MKCFYHNDPDGWCSAYWIRKYLEREGIPFIKDDFIEMNYDKHVPNIIYEKHEPVFIVDFSFDEIELLKIWNLTGKSPVWIDHHKSSIEKYENFRFPQGEPIDGIRYDGIAACALTWSYFFHELADQPFCAWDKLHTPAEIMQGIPLFTQYIHLWDTWQWKDHPDSKEINEFITFISITLDGPFNNGWDMFADDTETKTASNVGSRMIMFRDGYSETCCNSIGKIIEFEGFKCFACNMPKCNSEWFTSVDPSTYDILMPFYYSMQTKQFLISLYCQNSDIDVSKIAVKYGGGGHKGAAGFQCRDLPFKN